MFISSIALFVQLPLSSLSCAGSSWLPLPLVSFSSFSLLPTPIDRVSPNVALKQATRLILLNWPSSDRLTPGQSGWLGAAAVGSIPTLALSLFFQRLYKLILLLLQCWYFQTQSKDFLATLQSSYCSEQFNNECNSTEDLLCTIHFTLLRKQVLSASHEHLLHTCKVSCTHNEQYLNTSQYTRIATENWVLHSFSSCRGVFVGFNPLTCNKSMCAWLERVKPFLMLPATCTYRKQNGKSAVMQLTTQDPCSEWTLRREKHGDFKWHRPSGPILRQLLHTGCDTVVIWTGMNRRPINQLKSLRFILVHFAKSQFFCTVLIFVHLYFWRSTKFNTVWFFSWDPLISMSFCFDALKSMKISSNEPVSSQKFEYGWSTGRKFVTVQ